MDSLKKKWKSTRRYKGGVSIDEITNVVAILYMLIEMIAERMESVKKDLVSIILIEILHTERA